MSPIIAGHFQLQEQIEQARRALIDAGFGEDQISAFYVNQPGQHDLYELGGDRENSPGAKETPEGVTKGAAAGGVLGAAVGLATSAAMGPVGPVIGALLGAHVGSLYSLTKMKEAGEPEVGDENCAEPRTAGMLIAVALAGAAEEKCALGALRGLGAIHIERADGTIIDGDWIDFDPLSVPVLLD